MTWLQGTTTWGNLCSDLTKLICGEMADGKGITNATPWVREFAGEDTIRTPASKDVDTGACSTRTGYFNALGYTQKKNYNDPLQEPAGATVVKVKTPFTALPTSTSGRVLLFLYCQTPNAVSGAYDTSVWRWYIYDADTGSLILSNTNVVPSAAGDLSITSGLVVTISDPSGIVPQYRGFNRGFMTGYLYGIDQWPMLHRQGATAPVFSVAPPGVQGTDWDIVRESYVTTSTQTNFLDRGNLLHGLGIKTATANNGALYTVSHSMALIKARIFPSGTNGVLSLDLGQSKHDTAVSTTTYRQIGGMRISGWAQCFANPASVTATSAVQYFMSVTDDGIALVLNGDPGASGKLGTAFVGCFVPADPTYDVFPVMCNCNVVNYTGDTQGEDFSMALALPYYSQLHRQAGEEATVRDWQTNWLRCEQNGGPPASYNFSGQFPADITSSSTTGSYAAAYRATAIGLTSGATATVNNALPIRQVKPGIGGNWWLYALQFGESDWTNTSSSLYIASPLEDRIVRGQCDRFFFVPSDGWASGDELTDTATGTKYLLVQPDYAGGGMGSRVRVNTNTYFGGVAIAEL